MSPAQSPVGPLQDSFSISYTPDREISVASSRPRRRGSGLPACKWIAEQHGPAHPTDPQEGVSPRRGVTSDRLFSRHR